MFLVVLELRKRKVYAAVGRRGDLMSWFILSGFADEIAPDLKTQIEVLNRLDIHWLEMRGVNGKNVSDYTPEEMREIGKQLGSGGIRVSSIGSPIGKINICDGFDEHFEKFKNTVELAKVLETEYIRIFSFFMPEGEKPEKYRDEVLGRMSRFVKYAERMGITLLHENEKGIYGDTAPRCLDILESIGSERLRAVFDPANFVQCGQKTYPEAYEMLKPYISYMHVKDSKKDGEVVPSGMGDGCVREIYKALARDGYCGFASLEPHLTNFVGFSELEASGHLESLPEGGEKCFTAAAEAIRKIIAEL